jgi:hypothetical protein
MLSTPLEHPTAKREAAIVAKRTPEASKERHQFIAGLAKSLRAYTLEKSPSGIAVWQAKTSTGCIVSG